MIKLSTAVYISLIAISLQYAHVACASVLMKRFHTQIDQPDKVFLKYLNVLESSLVTGDEPQLNESSMYFLSMLVKKMEELRVKNELMAPQFWHLRQGR